MGHGVFLDRDGTLGGDGNYCHPEAFTLYPEVCTVIKLFNDAGLAVIVITNQTHIGRGEITIDQVEASFIGLQRDLAEQGAGLDGWYICSHTAVQGCACRKPGPLLLERAARDFGRNLHQLLHGRGLRHHRHAGRSGRWLPDGAGTHWLGPQLSWTLPAYLDSDRTGHVAEGRLDAAHFIVEDLRTGPSEGSFPRPVS